jgi:HK97 family phage major capsid protein
MSEKVKTNEERLREMLNEIVDAKMAPQFDELKKGVEDSVAKAISTETEKAKRIEVEDNFEKDTKGGFKSFGHYLKDIASFDQTSGRTTTKELDKWEVYVKAAGTGLSVGDAEYAGHLVPVEFRNDLLFGLEEKNDLLPRCQKMPMGSNILEIPYVDGFDQSGGTVWGGVQWQWTAELGSYSETRPKVEKMQLKLNKLTGLAYISDELLMYSPQSIEALIQRGFNNGLNFEINRVLVRGTGAGTPLGLINSTALVTISKEVGQAAGTIIYENIIKAYSASWNPANTIIIANINTFPQLSQLSLQIGTGGSAVWMPPGGLSGLPYPTIMGMPIFWNDQASSVGTVGDLIFADMSQYVVGYKSDMQSATFDSSLHFKFDVGQMAYRWSYFMAGQPAWKTYFTPAVATTSYRSPFVVIETRS